MMGHAYYHRLWGARVASFLPLPEVAELPDTNGADVVVVEGAVPRSLDRIRLQGPGWQAARDAFLLRLPGIASFLATGGDRIVVEPDPAADERDLGTFLLGSPFGALLLQRGLFPLHASAVGTGRGCVAFAGPTGAGKSAVAALLDRAGYPAVSDGLCAVEIGPTGEPRVFAGLAGLKLWPDTIAALGEDPADSPLVRNGVARRRVRTVTMTDPAPAPLLGVVVLDPGPLPGPRRLSGIEAIGALAEHTVLTVLLEPFARTAHHFNQCAAIARSLPVRRLPRAPDLESLAGTMRAFLDAVPAVASP